MAALLPRNKGPYIHHIRLPSTHTRRLSVHPYHLSQVPFQRMVKFLPASRLLPSFHVTRLRLIQGIGYRSIFFFLMDILERISFDCFRWRKIRGLSNEKVFRNEGSKFWLARRRERGGNGGAVTPLRMKFRRMVAMRRRGGGSKFGNYLAKLRDSWWRTVTCVRNRRKISELMLRH